MRQFSASGGLEFGHPNTGPWIDIIPLEARHKTLPAAALLKRVREGFQGMQWMSLKEMPAVFIKGMAGFVGFNAELAVRFAYPRGMKPLDALYAIELVDGNQIPPWLLAATYIVLRGMEKGAKNEMLAMGLHLILAAMSAGTTGREYRGYSRLSGREIKNLAEQLVTRPTEFAQLPTGAVDQARFWLYFSRLLWQENHLRRMATTEFSAKALHLDGEATHLNSIRFMLAMVSGLAPAISNRAHIVVRGVELITPSEFALVLAWPQALEWNAGGISPEALRWISQGRFPDPKPPMDDFSIRGDLAQDLAQAAADALLEEAEANAIYTPYGQFRLRLPDDSPLAPWGVKHLRVWAEPDKLWVQFVGQGKNAYGPSVEWRPGRPLREFVIGANTGAVAAANVTLAALWHDLVTAAEAALPEEGKEPAARAVRDAEQRRSQRRARRGRSYRKIPRVRVRLRGRRDWGGEAEQRVIRARHKVTGHPRRLPPGWKASPVALRWAKAHGRIVPKGYTYVRPHIRGGEAKKAMETVVRARGLETIITLSKKEN